MTGSARSNGKWLQNWFILSGGGGGGESKTLLAFGDARRPEKLKNPLENTSPRNCSSLTNNQSWSIAPIKESTTSISLISISFPELSGSLRRDISISVITTISFENNNDNINFY